VVASTFISYYVLTLLYVTAYWLSPFHPLAQYLGPIENMLSKFPMAYVVGLATV
jgi:hypothetical protein